jgi:cbb3-type cytochrome oxidase subunit 1
MMFVASNELVVTTLSPKILSLIHVMVLGWITMIIYGALYQLIPVVMEVKLYSERLAMTSFVLLAVGTPLMAYSFWTQNIAHSIPMMVGGTSVVISVLLFAINTIQSALKSEIKSLENRFIKASIFWLFATVVFGFGIILYPSILAHNALKIHIHLGVVGWFMMLVVGVASTLMPMFFIAHKLNRKFLHFAFYAINAGLVLISISFFLALPLWINLLASASILLGFVAFIRYNYEAYSKRLRKKLDIGMKHSVMAFVLLAITLITAFLSVFGNKIGVPIMIKVNLIYGISLIYGFLTALILGQMYKTLPFIVWLKMYQDKVGKFKTPLPADMHSQKVADAHYYTYVIGFVSVIAGVIFSTVLLLQLGAALMLITALLYAFNTFTVLLHKEKLEPLTFNKPSIKK